MCPSVRAKSKSSWILFNHRLYDAYWMSLHCKRDQWLSVTWQSLLISSFVQFDNAVCVFQLMVCSFRAALSYFPEQKINKTNWRLACKARELWCGRRWYLREVLTLISLLPPRSRSHYWEGIPLWHDQSQPSVADFETQHRSCPLWVSNPCNLCRTLLWLWLQQVLSTKRWLLHSPYLWPERQQNLLGRLDGTRMQQRFVTHAWSPDEQRVWIGFECIVSRLQFSGQFVQTRGLRTDGTATNSLHSEPWAWED